MNQPKAYGTFYKNRNLTFRESAYLQFGSSETSIGSFLMLNPGGASCEDVRNLLHGERIFTEMALDPTMHQIVRLMEAFKPLEPLNGRVHLFNLFTLQNTKDKEAISHIEYLGGRRIVTIEDMVASMEELKRHPWICIGWGVGASDSHTFLKQLKGKWLEQIEQAGIPLFGKKNPFGDYYHLCPHLASKKNLLAEELREMYVQKVKSAAFTEVTEFTSSAVKPNLYCGYEMDLHEPINGWSVSSQNPERIVKSFSGLAIQKGYKLRAYSYKAEGQSSSAVYAIPQDKELTMPANIIEKGEIPIPQCQSDHFMFAVDGDRTPLSYLQAAVVYHELGEFGISRQTSYWSADDILPLNEKLYEQADSVVDYLYTLGDWNEFKTIPPTLRPIFYYENDHPTVVFYTKNDVGMIKLSRYTHTFEKDSYKQKVHCEELAFAGIGILF
ncbi:hypothetical protein [Metabacillus sp. cB07]|uniref:hypothetical protein n=1 Tax=Metabacillus sp. cB07 TaxID=2806989 RepID=UPI00193991CA|nr:hypothetical protein [Metabacillus sp. cB07]